MATQNLGRVGLVLKGEWDSATAYTALDVVSHDGNAWAAKQNSTNVEPTTGNSDFWQLFSNNADLVATVQGLKEDAANSATAAAASAADAEASAQYGEDAFNAIAHTFDPGVDYTAGKYVWYSGELYRFNVAHPAGAWIGTDAARYTATDELPLIQQALGTKADAAEVADLKSALDDEYVRVATNESFWTQGSLNVSNGNTVASSNRIRTGFIDISSDLVCCEDGFFFVIFGYDSDSTYKGMWDGTSFHKPAGFPSQYRFTEYNLNKVEADKCKIVLAKDSGDDITPSEGTNFLHLKLTDVTLSLSNKPADAMVTGTRLDSADDAIESLKNIAAGNTDTVIFKEINGKSELIQGKAINSSGEEIVNNSSFCTDFIELLNDKQIIQSTITVVDTSVSYYHYIFYYDANKNYTGVRVGGSKKLTVKSTEIPVGAACIRISLTYTGIQNTTGYHLAISQITQMKGSPSTKWYILGDSISAGYYSMTRSMANAQGLTFDYVSPVTTESGEETGSVWDDTLAHNYWGYANRWELKRQLVGKARPGQGYYKEASNSQNGVYVVKNNDFSDAGLITVAWGFNDWHYNQPRGNHDLIDPTVPYPTEGYDTAQITTINQAIWYCLGELIRQAPNAKIVVQTPMNGWAYGGDWASNWGIGTEKSQSGTLANIHDDIVYWANYYGLQILDMTYNNSVVNRRNIKDTIIDGSHPSDAAHQQLGRHVAIALKYC